MGGGEDLPIGVALGSSTPEQSPLPSRGQFGAEVACWAAGVRRGVPGGQYLAPTGQKVEACIARISDTFGPAPGPERLRWLEAEGERFGREADPTRFKRWPWGWGDWLNDGCPTGGKKNVQRDDANWDDVVTQT